MIKCDGCGNNFEIGNRPDGLPNGVGFQMVDGTIIHICSDCMIKVGAMSDADKDKFFERLVKGNE